MAEAYIKLYRKLLTWEWYDDPNTCRLFLHCLLKANWQPTKWHGMEIGAGQFITSLATLSEETHLSIHQVRVALDHLKVTGEVASKCQGKMRIITVNNWGCYQGDGKVSGKVAARSWQGDGKVVATDKEYKEKEEEKEGKELKSIYGEYRHVRLTDRERDRLFTDYGEPETLAAIKYLDEYMQMTGKKYKDHNLALRKWVFNAVKEKQQNHGIDWSTV